MKKLKSLLDKLSEKLSNKLNDYFFPPAKEEAKPFAEWFNEMHTPEERDIDLASHYTHVNKELIKIYRAKIGK